MIPFLSCFLLYYSEKTLINSTYKSTQKNLVVRIPPKYFHYFCKSSNMQHIKDIRQRTIKLFSKYKTYINCICILDCLSRNTILNFSFTNFFKNILHMRLKRENPQAVTWFSSLQSIYVKFWKFLNNSSRCRKEKLMLIIKEMRYRGVRRKVDGFSD